MNSSDRTEFGFLAELKAKYQLQHIGDDCAVIPAGGRSLTITSDMLVENIDFRRKWMEPEQLGHKCLAVSLSDIAAMGAEPKYSMLSIAVPDDLWKSDFLDRFYAGWFKLANLYSVELVGGDLSRTNGELVVDITVIGEASPENVVYRSGARPGDSIFVTGRLGGAAAGLRSLESDAPIESQLNEMIRRQLEPTPQVAIGRRLGNERIASAMIDISDGLSADLGHLCRASGVGADLQRQLLPMDNGLEKVFATESEQLRAVLGGGEDYELLFTAAESSMPPDLKEDVFKIGEITPTANKIRLIDGDNVSGLIPYGFTHF